MTACIMEHLHISQFLGILVVMLVAAKVFGYLAQRAGQPAVLGELIGGVLVGKSVLGLVDPQHRDDSSGFRAGGGDPAVRDRAGDRPWPALESRRPSLAVAVVGVALPFALGFAACRLWGRARLSRSLQRPR